MAKSLINSDVPCRCCGRPTTNENAVCDRPICIELYKAAHPQTVSAPVKATHLHVENFLALKVVDVELSPDGGTVTIAGNNAAGKSSFLKAVSAALIGPKAMGDIDRPIREGADEAKVTVTIGSPEKTFVVTRKWVEGKTPSLKVTAPDGAEYRPAQTILNEFLGAISFDPLDFVGQDAKAQVKTLLSLVELPFDPAELEASRKAIYDERTEVGREVKAVDGQLTGLPPAPDDLPTEVVSTASILEEQQAYQAMVTEWRRAQSAIADEEEDLERAVAEVADLEQEIAELQTKLLTARYSVTVHQADVESVKARFAEMGTPKEIDFTERLAKVEATNDAIRSARDRARVEELLSEHKKRYAELTEELERVEKIKADGLAAADMPIDDLSFDENGVIYQGQPFKQASQAEQIRVSTAIAIAKNPTARIILIRDASLLDDDNLALLDEMAREHDFQCLVERVGALPDGAIGFEIVDGEIA